MAGSWTGRFRDALVARFEREAEAGRSEVEIRCGDLHDRVSPDGNRQPVCSGVMWVETTGGNCEVLYTPPRGRGTRPGHPLRPAAPSLVVRPVRMMMRLSARRPRMRR